MTVTLSGSVISFPPLSVQDFTPIHDIIVMLRESYNIEEITTIIDGEVKVVGLLIDEDAPMYFQAHVLMDVDARMPLWIMP
jgi:hypothetical protein